MTRRYTIPTLSGAAIAVKQSISFFRRKQQQTGFPFEAGIEDGRLSLAVPAYASVRIRNGLAWSLIHNGYLWGARGVGSPNETLRLSFPLSAAVRVHAQGTSWTLALQPCLAPEQKEPLTQTMKRNRFLGYSLIAHILFVGFLVSMVRFDQIVALLGIKPAAELMDPNANVTATDLQIDAGEGAAVVVPFSGISYAEFRRQLTSGQRSGQEINYLLNNLSALNVSGAGKTGPGTGSATAKLGTKSPLFTGLGGSAAGTGLTQAVQSQKFQDAAAGKAKEGRKLSDKEQAMIREKFRELQTEFKKVYSRVLGIDPGFAVTVAYEVKVMPTGYLLISTFKARGTYQPQALAKLQEGMGEIIQSTFVGRDSMGTVIRGENVFVR